VTSSVRVWTTERVQLRTLSCASGGR